MNLKIYPWQHDQWRHLVTSFKNNRMPHGLLLTGPSATGMEEFSMSIAAWLLCENRGEEMACGQCHACKLILSGNHPDLHLVEPEEPGKQIKVESIRSLIEFTQLTSQYTNSKVAIIQPADSMNRNSANALLKTLEEPSGNVVLLLVSDRPSNLAITIRSRCQRIQFHSVAHEVGVAWLMENCDINVDKAENVWSLSRGRPLLAMELLDTDLADQQGQVLTDLHGLLQQREDFMQIAKKWSEYGAKDVFNQLVHLTAAMTRSKLTAKDEGEKSKNNRDLQEIVNQLNLRQLMDCYDLARRYYQATSGVYNLNQTGLLEDFLLFWQGQTATGG